MMPRRADGFVGLRLRLAAALPCALAVALLLTLGLPQEAAGHAVLERSLPSANASLPKGPQELTLVFSEPVHPTFSSLSITDERGARLSGQVTLSADRRTLTVPIRPLAEGIYTVRWRVYSTLDAHTTSGFFAFAVGREAPAGSMSGGERPPGVAVAFRWLGFLGAFLLTGSALFQFLVLSPATTASMPAGPVTVEAPLVVASAQTRVVQWSGALLVLAGVVGEFAYTATTLLGHSLTGVLGSGLLWPLLSGTKAGWSTLLRAGLALLALVVLARSGRRSERRPQRSSGLLAGAGGIILAGSTMTSHASTAAVAAVVDWIHLVAAATWIGGLVALWLALRRATGESRQVLSSALVPRFSRIAGIGLAVLVLTGVVNSLSNVPSVRALAVTLYGKTLVAKVLLVLPLAALGAVNRFVLLPRLAARRSEGTAPRWLLRTISGEVGLGALVLLVAASLTITPPAKVSIPKAPEPVLTLAGLADGLKITLAVSPAEIGWNRYEVTVVPGGGGALAGDSRVLLRLQRLEEETGTAALALVSQGQGRYAAEGGELALAGWWELEVLVRQRGRLDVSASFPLRVGQPSETTASDPAALRLLERARKTSSTLRSWRELVQIADGNGGVAAASYEFVRPDRIRWRSEGTETILIGTKRYFRVGTGPWEASPLPQQVRIPGPAVYFESPSRARLGRKNLCEDEACRVVLWEAPGGGTLFAGWIGTETGHLHQLLMIAASHYMTLRASDFNAPIKIVAPQ